MTKKHYCQCINPDTGKKIRCTLESNLDMKFSACPHDRGYANWIEEKRFKFRLIRGGYVKCEEK